MTPKQEARQRIRDHIIQRSREINYEVIRNKYEIKKLAERQKKLKDGRRAIWEVLRDYDWINGKRRKE